MYIQSFSRMHSGCVVVLLDRSDSMKEPWGTSGLTLAQGAARAVNKILLELCIKSIKEVGGSARDYFSTGVYGYGARPMAGGEGVESAFGGALTGRDLVPLSELYSNPLAVREEPSIDAVSAVSWIPVWVEPVHGYGTPTCQAIATAGGPIFKWAKDHVDSFPPIVINITGGMATDSPFKGADLAEWAKRLTGIQTRDGAALLFNIFLSPHSDQPKLFPRTAQGLPPPGPELFEISSPLPRPMIDKAILLDFPVEAGARGFAFQGNLAMLVRLLEVGTEVGTRSTGRWDHGRWDQPAGAPDVVMQYPTPSEYFSAVQDPEHAFRTSSLKRARLAKDPVLGLPLFASGASAIVCKAIVDGEPRALRFFTWEDAASREHYTALEKYVREHDLTDCVATSEWLDDAIEVNGQSWPMLLMQWVEGRTLDAYVDYLVSKNDTKALASLAQMWRNLIARLQTARFAHGDLEHNNILMDTTGRLRLVDFDGSWIAPFAGRRPPSEPGHPNYYRRPNRPWGRWMDTFPGLLIYTSLVALSKDTRPWLDLYNDDNLLFQRTDFDPPHKTPVWNRLASIADEQLDRLLAQLKQCCAPYWVAEGSLEELLGVPPKASSAAVTPRVVGTAQTFLDISEGKSQQPLPPLKVFLCHSSSDKPIVRALYRRLRSENIQPWLDEENILPGQKWDDEIQKAIRESDVVLVCLSKRSVNKVGYLQKEIRTIVELADEQPPDTIFLIPIRLEPLDMPERFRQLEWADFFEESGYKRLMLSLRTREREKEQR